MSARFELSGLTVMVTGGSGFLGRVVCRELETRNVHEVIVPRMAQHDLTREADVEELMASTRPDVVIHLAAEVGGIGANRANPGRYFFANMAMGLNLIEAARKHGVVKFVQIGTVCSYPRDTEVPFKEDALWDGYPEETNAPYGIAKKALLVMLQAYREQYGLKGIYLMPVNLYGPGDNFDLDTSHVIPALIRKFDVATRHQAPFVEVWGTGSASREFLYVDDAARAIVKASESYDGQEPVNLGTGREVKISELVQMVRTVTDFDGEVRWDASKPDGQPRRMLDTSRARKLFGFEASVSLEQGLRETAQWWRSHVVKDANTPRRA